MNRDHPISLGDLARIKKILRPKDAETWNSILKMLDLPLEMALPEAKGTEEKPSELSMSKISGLDPIDNDPLPEEVPTPKPVFSPGTQLQVQKSESAVMAPAWRDPNNVFKASAEAKIGDIQSIPPLFSPGQGRALLTALAIALEETGELDEHRAIATIASGEQLQKIPLRLRPSSRYGVQLLVDRGARLQPFRADQQQLITDLSEIVGKHRLRVLRFSGFPDVAGPGSRRTWSRLEVPPAGSIVLVVSDLGLSMVDGVAEASDIAKWVNWGKWIRASGSHPVALVPYGQKHWPSSLRRVFTLVHWDRSTTVGMIRGARRWHA